MKEMNFYLFLTNIAIAVLCGVLLPILPKLTRKSLLFGVKIPLEQHSSPEAKNLRKRYTMVTIIGSVLILSLAIAQYVIFPDATLVAIMYFPLLFVAVQMAAFVPNWKRAKELKAELGWKVSGSVFAETKSSHSRGNLSELPWIWYGLSFILIIVSIIITLIKYPGLPDMIPTHFDANMQADAWSDKSLLAVMTMPLINLATLLIMWLTGVMLVRAKMQIDQQNPALSFTQHRIYRRRMGHSLGTMTLALVVMMALIGFMSLWPELNIPFWFIIALPLVPIIPLVMVSVGSGQGGCRIKPKAILNEASDNVQEQIMSYYSNGRGDDKYWALGMFYHNPDDPAYFVEDRFGTNFGFNYSRLPVKIGAAAAILAFIATYIWITILMISLM